MPRFFCPTELHPGLVLDLPAGAARHVQVLRMQPGDGITLFNGGSGALSVAGEFEACIEHMGRSNVRVRVGAAHALQREAAAPVHLALCMPANERMDWLVEKATELGVASLQPLMSERSVLRLSGERAQKKVAHWHSVAVAACEQCGGNRVPTIEPILPLSAWLTQTVRTLPRYVLSLHASAQHLVRVFDVQSSGTLILSGPEGGLSDAEEQQALAHGFAPVTLGVRVLRAETAALAALASVLAMAQRLS